MNVAHLAPPGTDHELLTQVRHYLCHRQHALQPPHDLEQAWASFYDRYAPRIRAYAVTCGVSAEEIADCVQEVWRELLLRLPAFEVDPARGKFDTWLFRIVQGKTADQHRLRQRRPLQDVSDKLDAVSDPRPNPSADLEEHELISLALNQLRKKLSECSFQVLHLRLVEQRAVADVAESLGISPRQVWYRYHRARRDLEAIGAALARFHGLPRSLDALPQEENKKSQESAQGETPIAVSRIVTV
jgi:RNA polymerase sigma factor (sigma-70 family)